jgi:hypothetical protein
LRRPSYLELRNGTREWDYLAAWEAAGIPIEAVVLGMHRTFENARRGPQNALVPRIRTIAYSAPEIYAAAEQLVEDEVAGHGDFRKSLRRHFFEKVAES